MNASHLLANAMRRSFILFCMMVLVFVWGGERESAKTVYAAGGQTEVIFTDPALENGIRNALQLSPETVITVAMMEGLVELDLSNQDIGNLEGIQHAANLTTLNLSGNKLSELTSGSSLTLLSELSELTYLDLSRNSLTNVPLQTILQDLHQLEYLNVSHNLLSLTVSYNQIFAHMQQLSWLDLSFNSINNLASLLEVNSIKSLAIDNISSIDYSTLQQLTQLEELSIANNGLTDADMAELHALTNLTALDLSENLLLEVPDLSPWNALTQLNLANNYIRDVSPLANKPQLERLDLSRNLIRDVASLNALIFLQELNLSNNAIVDLSGFSIQANLAALDLSDNQISDINQFSMNAPSTLDVTINFYGNPLDEAAFSVLVGKGATIQNEDNSRLRIHYEVTGGDTFEDDYLLEILITGEDPDEELILHDPNKQHMAHFSVRVVGADGFVPNVKYNESPWSYLPSLDDRIAQTDPIGRADLWTLGETNVNAAINKRNQFINDGFDKHMVLPLPPGEYDIVFETFRTTKYMRHITPISKREIVTVVVTGEPPEQVEMQDNPALESYIREYLALGEGDPLTSLDMALITKFHLVPIKIQGVQSLSGLEHAHNLISFSLYSIQDLVDLSALSMLDRLQYIYIRNSAISDVSFVSGMEQLNTLEIENSPITNLPDLSALEQLRTLKLQNTLISDLTPLQRENEQESLILQQLESLLVEGPLIEDISPISELFNLQSFYAENTSIRDLSPLGNLQQLESITIVDSFIKDLTPIMGLQQLSKLNLYRNIIEDIAPLVGLSRIDHIILESNLIRDIAHVDFAQFPQFNVMYLSFNPIQDYTTLSNLPALAQDQTASIHMLDMDVTPDGQLIAALEQLGYDVYTGTGSYSSLEINIVTTYNEEQKEFTIQTMVMDDPYEEIPATERMKLQFRLFSDFEVAANTAYQLDGGNMLVTDQFGFGDVMVLDVPYLYDENYELDAEVYDQFIGLLSQPIVLHFPYVEEDAYPYLELKLRSEDYDGDYSYELVERKLFSTLAGGGSDPCDASAGQFCYGSGTEANPYVITTPAQLDQVRHYPNSHYILGADIDLAEYIGTDVMPGPAWNDGKGWEPIGIFEAEFTGSLHGNGSTISNLFIDRENTNFVGLFGIVEEAVIEDVHLNHVNIKGASMVGALAGYANNSVISSSSVSIGSVEGYSSYTSSGGLIGENIDSDIIRSFASVDVTGSKLVGGLIGSHYTTEACDGPCGVVESYAEGTVTGVDIIGGLIGDNYGVVIRSYASGDVYGEDTVGGLVGHNWHEIYESQASGEVIAIPDEYGESSALGGLVGYNSGIIHESSASGNVIGDHKTSIAGGLAGANLNDSEIINSYATGDVTGSEIIGGLVGDNSGLIANTYATGTVSGHEYVGGLVGGAGGELIYSLALNEALVRLEGGVVAESFGRVAGEDWDGVLIGNRALEMMAGIGVVLDPSIPLVGDSIYGESISLAAAMNVESYTAEPYGWDFEEIWTMSEDDDFPYPLLRKLLAHDPSSDPDPYYAIHARMNKAGTEITVTFDKELDFSHDLVSSYFVVSGANAEIESVHYDDRDLTSRSVLIVLAQPVAAQDSLFIVIEEGAVKDVEGQSVSLTAGLNIQTFHSLVAWANGAGLAINEYPFTIIDVVKFILHGAKDVTGDGIFNKDDIHLLLGYIDSVISTP